MKVRYSKQVKIEMLNVITYSIFLGGKASACLCTHTMCMFTHLPTRHHLSAVMLPTRDVLYELILNKSKVYKSLALQLLRKAAQEREQVLGLSLAVSSWSGLTLTGCLELTQTSLSLLSSTRQGIKIILCHGFKS